LVVGKSIQKFSKEGMTADDKDGPLADKSLVRRSGPENDRG